MARRSMQKLAVKTPAKINWFLNIIGVRGDGYHAIESLMQCVSLYDTIEFHHASALSVESDLAIPLKDNLVYRAASLLKKQGSYRNGAAIRLKKNIPVGAGLGGGSSDAACTLSSLNNLWGLGLTGKDLYALASQIGSDVPFFLNGPAAFVEGRGEHVTPIALRSSVILLLVKPPQSVSTAWAYEAFDRSGKEKESAGPDKARRKSELTKKPVDIKLFCQALEEGDFTFLDRLIVNDLEALVLERYPAVREIRHRLKEMGASVSSMSGSGSAVFGVFTDREKAKKAARAMTSCWCEIVETLTETNKLKVES
jgi:4-diphosphocytidyl-2-C-methyl-D-erythritol kinase